MTQSAEESRACARLHPSYTTGSDACAIGTATLFRTGSSQPSSRPLNKPKPAAARRTRRSRMACANFPKANTGASECCHGNTLAAGR
jgi:hypothetical protein